MCVNRTSQESWKNRNFKQCLLFIYLYFIKEMLNLPPLSFQLARLPRLTSCSYSCEGNS